jgi:hypothetical protein
VTGFRASGHRVEVQAVFRDAGDPSHRPRRNMCTLATR